MSVTAESALAKVDSLQSWSKYEAWCWFSAFADLGLELRFMAPEEAESVRGIESEMAAKMGRLNLPALER